MRSLYLVIDLAVIAVPLAFSWYGRLRFVDRWKDFLPACLIVLAGFVAWDAWFTARGIWGFNDAYLLGIQFAGLPLEEWLFFLCVPYACVFTFHALGVLNVGRLPLPIARTISLIVGVGGLILVFLFPERLYTCTTSVLVAVYFVGLWWMRPDWLCRFWFAFLIILIPFVLTNGVLTGLLFWEYPLLNGSPELITDQIVWYNNAHNLGIRLFSIPLDDFLYAVLLIGLNVGLYEYFAARRSATGSGHRHPSPDHG